jgi:hypothetical protein
MWQISETWQLYSVGKFTPLQIEKCRQIWHCLFCCLNNKSIKLSPTHHRLLNLVGFRSSYIQLNQKISKIQNKHMGIDKRLLLYRIIIRSIIKYIFIVQLFFIINVVLGA